MSELPQELFAPGFEPGSTLLMGATGSGKTHSIRTAVEAGLEVFVIFTEPSTESLEDLPSDRVHWHYIPPARASWESMIGSATKINQMSLKTLANIDNMSKSDYGQFIELLKCLSNFIDDRTGKEYGPVDNFGPDKMVVLDSLSGVNNMAMNLVAGAKPVKSQADWQIAMDNLERLIEKLSTTLNCWFTLISHMESQVDEQLGFRQLMVSTLGRKLAPKLPRNFSDVILCKRDGNKFTWDTAEAGVDLKSRNLPIQAGLAPDFASIITARVERFKKGVASNG